MNLDTTSCRREVGEGGGRCFQGGPLWLQQASVHVYPTPTCYAPIVPLPAGHWYGRLACCLAQPANGSPEGLGKVWPQGSSSLYTPQWGLTLDHDTHRDTHSTEAVQAGWVTEVEAAASAHYGGTQPPLPVKHRHTYRNKLFGG